MRDLQWRFIVGLVALAGCSPSVADFCSPGSPECSTPDAALGDAGRDGGAEAEVAPSGCDPTKPPHDESCVIEDAFGIFVSPSGSDANPGSKSAPVRSLGHAMDLARAVAKRVYVCGGSYPEPLVVGTSRDGVNVYGGLDCVAWTYGAANRVVVAPAEGGYALAIEGLQTGVTFEDIEFDAQNASAGAAGASSVAVFVSSSQGTTFDRVTMVAGTGNDGAPGGTTGTATNWFGTPPAYAELNGNNAADAGAAPSKPCTCGDQSQTSGGQGGGPMNIPSPGAGTPAYADAGAGGAAGMNAVVCGSGGSPAANGADAPMPITDVPSTSLGTCSASGWVPGVGLTGADGKPGQGGGGGGNGRLSSGSGGGGACGGCGGAGGRAGQGGGASIALLSFQSSIALRGCTLTARPAGNGGAGGAAEAGQGGGIMGGNGNLGGCAGSAAGAGAGGNGGQGGPGGISLGIGYVGTPPTIDGAVVTQASTQSGITIGAAGAGGTGGLRGASASTGSAGALGASGQPGITAAVEAVP